MVSRFFWLVLSNLISLSRSWERKTKKHLSLHSSLDCSSLTGAVACVASVSVRFRNKKRTRNDEELDFRSSSGEKWDESQKWKRRGGEVLFLSSPSPPRSFTHHIFRAVFWHSFLVLCSETARKRLLRRLPGPDWGEGGGGGRLVSGSEGFAVYGLLLIMSLRGVWLVRPYISKSHDGAAVPLWLLI